MGGMGREIPNTAGHVPGKTHMEVIVWSTPERAHPRKKALLRTCGSQRTMIHDNLGRKRGKFEKGVGLKKGSEP